MQDLAGENQRLFFLSGKWFALASYQCNYNFCFSIFYSFSPVVWKSAWEAGCQLLKSRVFVCLSVCLVNALTFRIHGSETNPKCWFSNYMFLLYRWSTAFQKNVLKPRQDSPFSLHGSCHYNNRTACRVLVLMTLSNSIKSREALWGSSLASFPTYFF